MTWKEIEQIFNRSLRYSFSKKKFLFIFPILVLCGLLIVFCRVLAEGAGDWIVLSLNFLPVFLTSGLLLAAGVVLARLYYHEVKHLSFTLRKVLSRSWELLIGVSYLSLPLLLVYLILWMFLGIFYLLKEIPTIGNFMSIMLSFGPFLLMLGSLILCLLSFMILFFVTPYIAFKVGIRLKLAEELYMRFKMNLFSNFVLFLVGLLPLLLVIGILSLAASMTGSSFFVKGQSLSLALQWFFVMVPFCALLSPGVVFFFNFAVESYALMQKKIPTHEITEIL